MSIKQKMTRNNDFIFINILTHLKQINRSDLSKAREDKA